MQLQSQRAQLEREMDNKLQETKTNVCYSSQTVLLINAFIFSTYMYPCAYRPIVFKLYDNKMVRCMYAQVFAGRYIFVGRHGLAWPGAPRVYHILYNWWYSFHYFWDFSKLNFAFPESISWSKSVASSIYTSSLSFNFNCSAIFKLNPNPMFPHPLPSLFR